ncbi:MAG: STAS domain-containing protein [Fuerstiella sp.]
MSEPNPVFDFERSGNVLVVVPRGSLMEFRDADIRNAYNDTYRFLDDPAITHLLIDFSRLEYFGSTFVGMLIRLAKKARAGGGEAVLCSLSDNMQQMMKTLMLLENTKTDFFWVPFDSRAAALASLNQAGTTPPASTPKPDSDSPPPDSPPPASDEGGGWAKFAR